MFNPIPAMLAVCLVLSTTTVSAEIPSGNPPRTRLLEQPDTRDLLNGFRAVSIPAGGMLGTSGAITITDISSPEHLMRFTTEAYDVYGNDTLSGAMALSPAGVAREVVAGDYRYTFTPGDPGAVRVFTSGDRSVEYIPLGDWEGCRIEERFTGDGVKVSFVYEIPVDSIAARWRVVTDACVSFADGELTFTDARGAFLFRAPAPSASDAAGRDIPVHTAFSGDTLSYALAIPADALWPITLDPTTTIAARRDGHVESPSTNPYENARDATSGAGAYGAYLRIGQRKPGGTNYQVYRSFLAFPIPALTAASACTLFVYGGVDYSATDFDVAVVGARAYRSTLDTGDYSRFNGRETGTAHTGIILNTPLNTSSHIVSGWNRLVLNAAGRDSVKAAAGDTLWIALLSSREYANTPPSGDEYIAYNSSGSGSNAPYLSLVYAPAIPSPANFVMTAIDTTTIACSWTDTGSGEERFYLIDAADSTVMDTLAANATADTLRGLAVNSRHAWIVVADSAGYRGYSAPDTCHTLASPPRYDRLRVRPISSDTLLVSIAPPPNPSGGLTGMEVDALAGPGATDSGWIAATGRYRDGGISPGLTYSYRVRFRNGDGIPTAWSASRSATLGTRDSLTISLSGDWDDDYMVNGGGGVRNGFVVRAGRGDDGSLLEGFLSFPIPWQVQKGGVDSVIVSLNRTAEVSAGTPALVLRAVPQKTNTPVEGLSLAALDSSEVSVQWTVPSGTGARRTPNLRTIFRAWQDTEPLRDYPARFLLRLGPGSTPTGVRAVFTDAADTTEVGETSLRVYFTPGPADSIDSAPDDLTLTAIAPDSIEAHWTDTSALELGFILVDDDLGTPPAGADTLAENTTHAGLGGLVPDTSYRLRVRAFGAENDSLSPAADVRTPPRTPGAPMVTPVSAASLRLEIDPRDNPSWTRFAVEDSLSGRYVDPGMNPARLREGMPEDWAWRTYSGWGGAAGDTLGGFGPDTRLLLRVRARSGE